MTDQFRRDSETGLSGKLTPFGAIRSIDMALLFSRLGTASFLLFQTHDNVLSTDRMDEFAAFLAANAYPLPATLAPLVVGTQIVMALLLLSGLLVRVVGLALMGMFFVALVTVHLNQPFNLWWPALALVQFGAVFAAAGGGVLGIDRCLEYRKKRIAS